MKDKIAAQEPLSYERLSRFQANHPTWRLLRAEHSPLILSFFYRVFILPNRRAMRFGDLVSQLETDLYQLNRLHQEERYPRAAKAYLEEWCSNDNGYLRKYYTRDSDEPECDLTPASEKAIEWLMNLTQREFVGTESRLYHLLQLLRELVTGTETDPERRLQELETQKVKIEAEIARVKAGSVAVYDTRQIKERFMQAEEMARRLLGDFRQVEYNFRSLDREARERIALSDKEKGTLLDEIFAEQDVIRDSDQGKSFKAFWEFLMTPARQTEMNNLLEAIYTLPELEKTKPDQLLQRLPISLLEAGEKVYINSNLLAEQLRKYLDDQAYLANKRMMTLINDIEKQVLAKRENLPLNKKDFMLIDEFKCEMDTLLSSTLFSQTKMQKLNTEVMPMAIQDIAVDALFEQVYVDETALGMQVEKALQTHSQISLAQLLKLFPLQKGLAELVMYLKIAGKRDRALIDEIHEEYIDLQNKRVRLPKVVFIR